ncbi:MAG: outer membrane lipoprotein-sorting protein [Candidatus Omnitrophota bacterium]
MRNFLQIMVIIAIILTASCVFAQMSVTEIVTNANKVAYYEGNDGKSSVTMTITDAQGRLRKRVFKILRFDVQDAAEQKYYVYFSEPADVQDMVYMVWKHLDRDDDRWMYLPALDLVRRIAATDKRSSFVGSNFVYEDISGRSLDLDKHELIDDENFYKIKNTPLNAADVEFAYFIVDIRKDNFLPVKAEYYDPQGKLFKTVEALETKDIQGHPTVTKSKATDLNAGSNTVIEFSQVEYDLGLEDNIFSERFLRRPPRQWLD